jgi:3-isopropylmalate/(R)-2-methylmalate dehydratase small subunit
MVTDAEAVGLMDALSRAPTAPMTVDLEQQTIVLANLNYHFTIDPERRTRLLNGWDDIALTKSYRDKIAAFKAADRQRRPWAIPT